MNGHSARPDRSRSADSRGGGDKREKILVSALKVFASKGFFGAKVADIADDAGVADGTIYLYFKSKDDILISLFEEQMERVNAELVRATADDVPAPEKLRRFIRAYMNLVEQNRHATEVITIELRQSAKFMKEYANPRFAEFLKILASVIDEGQKQGLIRNEVPASVAARALFGALDEIALMWVTGHGPGKLAEKLDLKKVGEWIGNVVLEGLERRAQS